MARMGPKPGTVRKLPPHDTITEGGAVGVLLSNRPARVWIDQADYDRIVKTHGNRVWAWIKVGRFVKLYVGLTMYVSVARLVVGDGGYFIRYADGDRLNLRRKNLSTEEPVRPGAGVKRDTPAMPKPVKSGRTKALKAAPSQPVFAPRTETPPVPFIQVPAPSAPATAMFAKRSLPVVSTVKRPGKPKS